MGLVEVYALTFIPGNYNYDKINSDKLAPPGTDSGQTINAQWPLGEFIGRFTRYLSIEAANNRHRAQPNPVQILETNSATSAN